MGLDIFLFSQINNFALKYFLLDASGIFIAQYLPWILISVLILFLLSNFRKHWRMLSAAAFAGVFARIITEIIRLILPRARPFVDNQVNLLLQYPLTNSFPSGHAGFFFALSTIIYFYNKKAGISFFFASFLIGLARVFSGIHWPSDILAGAIVGIFSGWLISKTFSIICRWIKS